MIKPFQDFAINSKLTMLVVLAAGVALLLSCIGFVTNDMHMIRASMIKRVSALADLLGASCTAALHFDDPHTASDVLDSLRKQPSVEMACLYSPKGQVFATYQRSGTSGSPPPLPERQGYDFTEDGLLEVTHEIDHAGVAIGTIYLRASMHELKEQRLRYVNIVAVVTIASLAASIMLSSRLQRAISVPILRLSEAAVRVSAERDYTIRVKKTANDELGMLVDEFNGMLEQIQKGEADLKEAHDDLESKILVRTAELSRANKDLSREIAERMRAEQELDVLHQQLLTSARRAGMAEIATGVLHNVGNVLNSINVSATLACDRIRQSKVGDLARVVQLIDKHAANLGAFISADPKGKQLPAFLGMLSTHLADERADILRELDLLTTKINHVKTIISTQQSYAGVMGVAEVVDIADTLDDALKLNSASFDRHKIAVERRYADIPKIRLDKQKVLQILVNLIKNAKDAFSDSDERTDRKLTMRTRLTDENTVQILISDNGIGIPPENLTRIFSHGFTTKKTGHGFGLHSCANAANELGGSLIAESDGPGQGATFILEVPYEPAEVTV